MASVTRPGDSGSFYECAWENQRFFFRYICQYQKRDANWHLLFDTPKRTYHEPRLWGNSLLQQYYFEEYLIDAIAVNPLVDLRWEHSVTGIRQNDQYVDVTVSTPEGDYSLEADYVLACDGVHSFVREALGVPFAGERFDENFLIADILRYSISL